MVRWLVSCCVKSPVAVADAVKLGTARGVAAASEPGKTYPRVWSISAHCVPSEVALRPQHLQPAAPPPCPAGSLFASVYSGVFYPDKANFLLFLALAPVAVGLLALPWVSGRGGRCRCPGCYCGVVFGCGACECCCIAGWRQRACSRGWPHAHPAPPRCPLAPHPAAAGWGRPSLSCGQRAGPCTCFSTAAPGPPGPSSAGQPLQLCAKERAGERAARVHRRWGSGWEPRLQAAPHAPCPARGTAQVCPTPARTHPDPTPLTPHAEGRFIFSLQALGTLGVYLITGATFNSLYPLSQSARLTVTVGAGLLLLPLLLVPHGSGGLLSQKAVLHTQLSHYQDQDDPPPEDEEAAAEGSLTQPLLQPGMQRDAAPEAAAAAGAAEAGHSTAAEQEEGSEADSELAAAIAASLREAEAAGLASHQADAAAAGQLVFEPAALDGHVQDLISFEPAVLDDSVPAARSATADGLGPPAAAAEAEAPTPPAAAPASDGPAAQEPQPASGRPPSPFAEPGPQAQLPPELSPMQCLRSSDFWLLFLVLCIGMGSGLTLVNNLSQLVKALTGGASALETTPVLVSAFSVCNCAGEGAAPWGWWELLWLWV